MQKEKIQKLCKILVIASAAVGIASLVLFIPTVRNFIIDLGELYVGRQLTREVWHGKLIRFGISNFLFGAFLFCCFRRISSVPFLEKILSNQRFLWLFCAIVSVCTAALSFISGDIWLDETFSLGLARHSVRDLVSLTASDVHPPLYYLILKCAVLLFPHSIAAAKFVSVIPVVILIFCGAKFLSKEYSSLSAFLFVLILFSTNSILQYAVEIRMYSWGALFVFFCAIASFYMVTDERLRFFLLFLVSAECGAYTQYWVAVTLAILFVLAGIMCIAKDKNSWKKLCVVAVLAVVLYLPWLKTLAAQFGTVSENYWIGNPSLRTIISYVTFLFPYPISLWKIALMLFCAVIMIKNLVLLFNRKLSQKDTVPLLFAFVPFLVILTALTLCILIRPIFVERYALPSIPLLAVFLALALAPFCKKKNISVVFALILGLQVFVLSAKSEYENRKALAEFKSVMSEHVTDDTVFVPIDVGSHIPRCLAFLYPEHKHCAEISELWTSAYQVPRENLVSDYAEKSDICFVVDDAAKIPEKYSDCPRFAITFSNTYRNLLFCFTKYARQDS